jgi:hypothetical protein
MLKMNATIVCTEDYENKHNWTLGDRFGSGYAGLGFSMSDC